VAERHGHLDLEIDRRGEPQYRIHRLTQLSKQCHHERERQELFVPIYPDWQLYIRLRGARLRHDRRSRGAIARPF
jgi:hypothetical protein